MSFRLYIIAILFGVIALMSPAKILAQETAEPDSSSGFIQEYFTNLMEEWRVEQIENLAKQWGITNISTRGIKMNRSFWEERSSLVMWLPRSNSGQRLILEYKLNNDYLVRGEIDRHFQNDNAWIDFIFRREY